MINLNTAHKQFVDHLRNEGKSESTLIAYSKDIEQLMEHLMEAGVNLVTEIELIHLENFMKKLADENYTPKSISRKTNATRTFMKFLQKNNHIERNVSEMLRHPKLETKAPRILSKLEYRALRDAARSDSRTFAMIEVFLQTGVTISELADMKMENINIQGGTGTLFVPKKNNKDARSIPLNKAAIEAINNYIEHSRPKIEEAKYLFVTKTGKPLLVRNIRSTIDRHFKIAGVEKAKVNDLRHTFVAHHLMSGVSIVHISKIAGHKRISTTERYSQYIEIPEAPEKNELGVL